jgi:hypothetical protein
MKATEIKAQYASFAFKVDVGEYLPRTYKVDFLHDPVYGHYTIVLFELTQRGYDFISYSLYSGEDISERSAAIAVVDYLNKKLPDEKK